jgi:hypothetical protein
MDPTGAIVMSAFGAIWFAVGVAAAKTSPILYGIALSVPAIVIVLALRQHSRLPQRSEEESRRVGRLIGIVSGIEGGAIFVGALVLANTGQRGFIAPMVAMVVGAHFVPLARALPARSYYGTAAILVAIGIAGCFVGGDRMRVFLVCMGAASTLWLTSIGVLLRAE